MGAGPSPSGQRKVERLPFTELLRVRKPTLQHGKGVDIGVGGICFIVPQTIAEGTTVEVELFGGSTFVTGKVRRASQGPGGFRIGIEFPKEETAVVAKVKALQH